MHILLIEDDKRVADFLSRGLRAESHTVNICYSGTEGLLQARKRDAQLILLDVMLPGMNGMDVCQTLRSEGLGTPVLMLSAMGTVENRVAGLRCGADDYLAKPFAFEELLARLEALSRRGSWHTDQSVNHTLAVGDLCFDLDAMTVTHGGKLLSFTAKELALVELLMRHPDRLYSRERILSNVWGAQEDPLTNVVDVYIARIRSKLAEHAHGAGCTEVLETVRGLGYKLNSQALQHTH